jgi:hypothetical protein
LRCACLILLSIPCCILTLIALFTVKIYGVNYQ